MSSLATGIDQSLQLLICCITCPSCLGAQAASATGAARETAQEAVRRAEDNLQAAKDKAKEVTSSAYQATKGKAYETYEAGRDTAQQAVERGEAALQAARDKVGRSVAASAGHLT